MNLSELGSALLATINTLQDKYLVKLTSAAVVVLASEVVGTHAELLVCFVVLVIVDLLTKWIELSKTFLVDNLINDNPSIIQAIKAIPLARKAGVINSEVMKHRFLGKIVVYMIVVLVAGLADRMFKLMNNPGLLVNLAVCYLATTEMISICENLQAAGVESIGALINIVQKKTGIKS